MGQYNGSISAACMWTLQVLVSWWFEGQTKTIADQMLVDYWDPDSKSFQMDGMSLTIEVEDIYFITGLS